MSYYVLKSANFDKKAGTIDLTVAENNVFPRTYYPVHYGSAEDTFEEKIVKFYVSMLEGSIQGGRGKVRTIYDVLVRLKGLAKETDFSTDLALKVERDNGLNELVSKLYAVPAVMTGKSTLSKELVEKIKAYDAESKEVYEAARKEIAAKGWVITGSCGRSEVFPGCDVFSVRDSDRLIIAEDSCYMSDHLGFCDTTRGRAVDLGEGSGALWRMFAYGYERPLSEITERIGEAAAAMIPTVMEKLKGFCMAKDPYLGFDRVAYGF